MSFFLFKKSRRVFTRLGMAEAKENATESLGEVCKRGAAYGRKR